MVGDVLGEVGAELLGCVSDAEDVNQQLGELEGARGNLLSLQSQGLIAAAAGYHSLLVAQGGNAGTRGGNGHIPVPGVEGLDVVLDNFVAVVEVTRIDVHLGATGLVRGEDNLVAQALKNFDGGASYAGVHAVNNARGEECNTHDLPSFPLYSEFLGLTACVWGRRSIVLRTLPGRWWDTHKHWQTVHAPSGGGMRWDQKPW